MRPWLLLACAGLAACGPIVQVGGGGKAPAELLTLSATTPPPAGAPRDGAATIGVSVPIVPGPLQTLRLPVAVSDTSIQYLAGASWADQPNKAFQRLLVDTLAGRGAAVVDLRTAPAPAHTVAGVLNQFGLDVRDPARPQVVVRFDAELLSHDGSAPRLMRFTAAEPVASQTPETVAAALNRAANRVAGQVADWALR
jgi:cholesterol transport system auxiliary component